MSLKGRRRPEDAQVDAAIASVRNDSCRDLIADIREGAANEYLRVKRHKQSELHHRFLSEDGKKSGALSRAQKKKVDNHASAVASRCKQEFLVSGFETLLRRKLEEAQLLTAACTQSRTTIVEQMRDLRAKDAQINVLRKQLFESKSKQRATTWESRQNDPSLTECSPATSGSADSGPRAQAHKQVSPMGPSAVRASMEEHSPFASSVHSSVPAVDEARSQSHVLPNTLRSPKVVGENEAVVQIHGLGDFRTPAIVPPPPPGQADLSLHNDSALENQDVGAAMDEIIAPGETYSTMPQTFPNEAVIPSELFSKHDMATWEDLNAKRGRVLNEQLLKASLQSENLSNVLNPVA